MIDPLVRPALGTDAAELAFLDAEARALLVDARGGARWLEEHPPVDSWEARVRAGGVTVAVLVHEPETPPEGIVVGFLAAAHDERTGISTIESVYITGAARELGFGDELIAVARGAAVAAGARYLEGTALPGDRDTKNLYERAGITARAITVSTRLTPLAAAVTEPS